MKIVRVKVYASTSVVGSSFVHVSTMIRSKQRIEVHADTAMRARCLSQVALLRELAAKLETGEIALFDRVEFETQFGDPPAA